MVVEEYVREHILGLTGQPICAKAAVDIISRTTHMVRSRSVAIGAGMCIFAARLAEAIGAIPDFSSVIPGKGILTHQILALALPSIFLSDNRDQFIDGVIGISTIEAYVEEAFKELNDSGIINTESPAVREAEDKAREYATMMLYNLSRSLPVLVRRMGLNREKLRVITETTLYSYRFHIVGVVDAVIEDPLSRKAVVVEWKTGKTPSRWELAQAYVYALLEA